MSVLLIIAPGFVTVTDTMRLDKYLLYARINEAGGHLTEQAFTEYYEKKNLAHTADTHAEWSRYLRGRGEGVPPSSPKLPCAAPGTSFASLSFSRMVPAASSSWSIRVLMDHHLCAKRKHLSTELLRLPSNLTGTKSLLYPLLNSTEVVWLLELGVQWGRHTCQLAMKIKGGLLWGLANLHFPTVPVLFGFKSPLRSALGCNPKK